MGKILSNLSISDYGLGEEPVVVVVEVLLLSDGEEPVFTVVFD